jgi:diguanylate cyclase (GGDEF)-like protein
MWVPMSAVNRPHTADPLTGIASHVEFQERLAEEWRRAKRYRRRLGLLMLGLDELLEINLTGGRAAGDRVRREVAACISAVIRDSDIVARLARDEFVVLCPETSADALKRTEARLWEQLEARGISVSIGRAEVEPGEESPEDLVARADIAMHRHQLRRHTEREGKRRREAAGKRPTARPDLAIPSSSAPRAS